MSLVLGNYTIEGIEYSPSSLICTLGSPHTWSRFKIKISHGIAKVTLAEKKIFDQKTKS